MVDRVLLVAVHGRQERRGIDRDALGRVVRSSSRVESVNAPYALQVFASTDATPPTALAGWGEPLADKAFADVPGVVETTVSTPASHLLIWLTELGPDSGCSTANPYRGRLAEITFTA